MRYALLLFFIFTVNLFGNTELYPPKEYINTLTDKNYDITYLIIHNYKNNSILFENVNDIEKYSQSLKLNINFKQYKDLWIERNSNKRIIIHFTLNPFTIKNESFVDQKGYIVILTGNINNIKLPEYKRGNIFTSFTFSDNFNESNDVTVLNKNGYIADLFIKQTKYKL
jgi:hypothetical protein